MRVARKQPRANDAVDEGEDKDGRDSQDARKEGHHTEENQCRLLVTSGYMELVHVHVLTYAGIDT